jgi:hypothetical protein
MEHLKAVLVASAVAVLGLVGNMRGLGLFAAGVAVVILLDLAWRKFRAWRAS